MDQYILDHDKVELALQGGLRHGGTKKQLGKFVIVVNENIGIAALQVLFALSLRPELAIKSGAGIATRGADRRWRKVTSQEIANMVKDEFVITRVEVNISGEKRLRIVDELPRTFPATIQQTRWWGNDVFSWFKRAENEGYQ